MKQFLMAVTILALICNPALANFCPTIHQYMLDKLQNRADEGAKRARAIQAEAWALHRAGKHAESVRKYEEAADAAGIEIPGLGRKKR